MVDGLVENRKRLLSVLLLKLVDLLQLLLKLFGGELL